MQVSAARVQAAHADGWQEQGRLRSHLGGGFAELPGIRLMASGLPHPQWNNGDVTDPALVDIDVVRAWYADRGVPWGVRVPVGMDWAFGRRLFRKRLMGLDHDRFTPATSRDGISVRAATPADLDDVLRIDCAAFEEDPAVERPWVEPHLHAESTTVALALLDGEPAGTAYALRSDGVAGPAVYLAGVAVLPEARRRGVAAAVSSWLLADAFADGAELGHLHPDDDAAARIYARLGFVEVAGFDVYVELG